MKSEAESRLSEIISNIKFKKKIIGGVDEIDVWKKIETIHLEYNRIIETQAEKYEAIIKALENKGDKK